MNLTKANQPRFQATDSDGKQMWQVYARILPAGLLQQIYEALSERNRRFGDFAQYAPLDDIIIARGWVYNIELEELLLATDSRVAYLDLNRLTEYLEIPWRTVYKRPR